jgi:hypothetical protein
MWPFNNDNQYLYQQYAQGYDTNNYSSFDPMQALSHLTRFIQGAPMDLQQPLLQQHFSGLPFEQRQFLAQQMPPEYGVDPNNSWSLAQGISRMGQERPDLLQRILAHPFLLTGALALTGLVARHMLTHHTQSYQQPFVDQSYVQQPYSMNNGYTTPPMPPMDEAFYQQMPYNNQGFPQQQPSPFYDNQGYPAQQGDLRQEINRERREERELQQQILRDERREEQFEEREHRYRDTF